MTSWHDPWLKLRRWLILANSCVKVSLRIQNKHKWREGKYDIWQQKGNHPSWLQKLKWRPGSSGRAQCQGTEVKVISDQRGGGGFCKQQYNEGRLPPRWQQGRQIADCWRRPVTSIKPPSVLSALLGSSGVEQGPLWLIDKETMT